MIGEISWEPKKDERGYLRIQSSLPATQPLNRREKACNIPGRGCCKVPPGLSTSTSPETPHSSASPAQKNSDLGTKK
jgi:hypothetical protein